MDKISMHGAAVVDAFTSTYHLTPESLGPERFDTLCGLKNLHPVIYSAVRRMDRCQRCNELRTRKVDTRY